MIAENISRTGSSPMSPLRIFLPVTFLFIAIPVSATDLAAIPVMRTCHVRSPWVAEGLNLF